MRAAVSETDVLYVSGFGRSGSTVVEGLLQERYAATGLGEIFFLWERGALRNELCGCGLRFRQCPFWSAVLKDAFGRITEFDAAVYDREFKRARGRRPQFHAMRELEPATPLFCDVASALYAAIGRQTDGETLIDSSKYPLFGAWLAATPGVRLSVLHLFRDPRGVAHSWSQLKERPESVGDQDFMAVSRSPLTSVWRWKWFNHWSEELREEMSLAGAVVSYERFCDDPEGHLEALGDALGLRPRAAPKSEWHSVSGNPMRFDGGDIAIRKDDRWRSEMSRAAQTVTTMLCGAQHRRLLGQAEGFLREASGQPE